VSKKSRSVTHETGTSPRGKAASAAPRNAPASLGGLAPLGDTRNSLTPPPPEKDVRPLLREHRAERYRLLSEARAILVQAGRREGMQHPDNFHRTAKCRYVPHGNVSVLQDHAHKAAFYAGLTTCGNVWTCPLCSVKVQERRREEIAKAIQWAYTQNLQPVMVTLTFPHGLHDQPGPLFKQHANALALMRQGAPWKRLKDAAGYVGVIRSLEVTYGSNGWHPHTHEIWFVNPNVEAKNFQKEISKHWESACSRSGILPPEKVEAFRIYAVDVKGWCSAGDYLAKQDSSRNWGADRELAKGGSKAGKSTGKHPFSLLAAFAEGDSAAGNLFLAFALAIKGKQQLLWSPGLKKRVGVETKTDEELAEEEREDADLLASLTRCEWNQVRLYRVRAQLLDAAELGGWPAMRAVLDSLPRGSPSAATPEEPPEADELLSVG